MSIHVKITYMKDTGKIIFERRKELKLTQKEVGRAAGVSSVTVGYWEKNQHKPSGEHLLGLARILRMRPEDIVGAKAFRASQVEHEAEMIRQAYLNSSADVQELARRMFGTIEEIDKSRQE